MFRDPWEDLMHSLNSWAAAREVPGGIEVTFSAESGERRVVEIVMTRDDWEEMADNIGAESPTSVRSRLLALDGDELFLVGTSGVELEPSATRELPPDDFDPEPGGYWAAVDDAGNIQSRFGDWKGHQT